jgi:putative spermidine/putrescine transport system substrate-binding protein
MILTKSKVLIAFLFVGASITGRVSAHQDVTFTSWTGPYMRSQMLGFVRPYEQESGKKVQVAHYAGGIDAIRDQVESENPIWDVVDLTQADSLRACNEGLLEKIDHSILPNGVDGSSYRDDFIKGALNPCGVGVIVWGTAFAFDNKMFAKNPPSSIADFFNVKRFPGNRAIRKDPAVIMEWALLADGVPAIDVYKTLSTTKGLERAFKKLDQIKPFLRWWKDARDPVKLLNSGEVAMSSVWATTGTAASKEQGSNFTVEWDGRVIEMDLFGIVKGSRNLEEATNFIRFASSSQSLAEQAKYLANGPTRKSSMQLISEEIRNNLPNGPAYSQKASIWSDAQWGSKNYASVAEKFNNWAQQSTRKGAAGTVR